MDDVREGRREVHDFPIPASVDGGRRQVPRQCHYRRITPGREGDESSFEMNSGNINQFEGR